MFGITRISTFNANIPLIFIIELLWFLVRKIALGRELSATPQAIYGRRLVAAVQHRSSNGQCCCIAVSDRAVSLSMVVLSVSPFATRMIAPFR